MSEACESESDESKNKTLDSLASQVMNNDYLLHQIVRQISEPNDVLNAKLVSKKWNYFVNNYQDKWNTLTIILVSLRYLRVTYGDNSILVYCKHQTLIKREFDAMKARMTTDYFRAKKIVIKGIKCDQNDHNDLGCRLSLDDSFGPFLDQFLFLKHLVLDNVCMTHGMFDKIDESNFINLIERLHLIDVYDCNKILLKFVGPLVNELHVTETMLRSQRKLVLWLSENPINVVVYIDEEKWPIGYENIRDYQFFYHREGQTYNITWHVNEMEKYKKVIYYKCFSRKLNLDNDVIPSIKHCEDLRDLKLFKLRRDENNPAISKLLEQIRGFKKLTKLYIDGYFTREQLRKLSSVLKNRKYMTHLLLRVRPDTRNPRDWVQFIKHLPKCIQCIKLDGLISDAAITALKSRMSHRLYNLDINFRGNQMSPKSLKRVTQEFPNLMFLKLNGIEANLEHYALLKDYEISKVEFRHDQHLSDEFLQEIKTLFDHSKSLKHVVKGKKTIFTVSEIDRWWYG